MCCALLMLFLLGPRVFNVFWWIFQPARWQAAFNGWFGGTLWWIWPVLGIIFLPWTTLMYIIVAPGGIVGWDWFWLILFLIGDLLSYGGGAGRQRLPGYEGY
jgi:hypothetical protein